MSMAPHALKLPASVRYDGADRGWGVGDEWLSGSF